MAYRIERTTVNDYRCSCCTREHESEEWVQTAEEALAALPTEFPVEGEWGAERRVRVVDGATGEVVASSELSWPPNSPRGAAYRYTRWSLRMDEEAFPGRGRAQAQVIKGRRYKGFNDEETPAPEFVDRPWSDLLGEISEEWRKRSIAQAEADKAEAERRIKNLTKQTE